MFLYKNPFLLIWVLMVTCATWLGVVTCSGLGNWPLMEDQSSVFSTFSGKKCAVQDAQRNTLFSIECSRLSEYLHFDSPLCSTSQPRPWLAVFPSQIDRPMFLCQKNPDPEWAKKDHFRVVVFGDSGVGEFPQKDRRQGSVAKLIHQTCASGSPCDFGLHVGDVIYPEGISDVFDQNFYGFFEHYYSSLGFPIFGALGNHDYHKNTTAFLEVSHFSKTWRAPDRFFKVTGLPSWLEIQVVDTTPLEKGTDEISKWAQLKDSLCASPATWKWVVGHHPAHSAGKHGPSLKVREKLEDLVRECKVNFYFSGHEHHLQWTYHNSAHYLISGGGGASRRLLESRKNATEAVFNHHGFLEIQVNPEWLNLKFHKLTDSSDSQTVVFDCKIPPTPLKDNPNQGPCL